MSDCTDPTAASKGPWKAIKIVADSGMLVKFFTGQNVIVEHVKLPADVELSEPKQNGTDTEWLATWQTFDARTCKCAMPKLRINYSTGG